MMETTMFDNYDMRREIILRAITVVCEDEHLQFKVKMENDEEIIELEPREQGNNNLIAKYSIKNLIYKYQRIDNIVDFGKMMLGLFNSSIANYKLEQDDPNYMETVLTTMEKSKNFYIELVPRNDYWHNTGADPTNITTDVDGVRCIWAVSSDRSSAYINEKMLELYPKSNLELLKKRRILDFTRHKQQVRSFEAPSVVEWSHRRVTRFSNVIEKAFMPEREAKGPHVVKYFEGPRIFELMTYPESCKAVMDHFNFKINDFTVFGLTNDVVYIEETVKDDECVTNDWDREILLNRLVNRNERRFPISPEHKGTKMKLKKVKSLKIEFDTFESDLMMEDPLMHNFFRNNF